MKLQWSALFSLLLLFTLASCGEEQFGTTPRSESSSANPLVNYVDVSKPTYTLIKPQVDVLYVVDNSGSSYSISSSLKNSISSTVNTLSQSFDYRIINYPLLPTAGGFDDYQVLTNTTKREEIDSSKIVNSYHDFNFFSNPLPENKIEKGLQRIIDFITQYKNGLIRKNSYLIVVLVSNGRDYDVEPGSLYNNSQPLFDSDAYTTRLASFRSLKSSLNAIQLRLFALSATSYRAVSPGIPVNCPVEYRRADKSYRDIARQLYADSLAQDNPVYKDSFNLCVPEEVNNLFSSINESIKQVVLKHEYSHAPITFAEDNEIVSLTDLQVKRVDENGTVTPLIRGTHWEYVDKGSRQPVNLRSGPNPIPGPGEPHIGRHFVRFLQPIVYPSYVHISSISKTEYFGYVVLPQKPKSPTLDNVTIRINGAIIPKSALFDETGAVQTKNIKVVKDSNPPVPDSPIISRTGYMIRLSPQYYYKSGDKVEVNYIPAGI